ncbi:sulfite exporter TauE/SafE family protein [Acuticoccus mangrovi]|uniref:Probable membrane transporter protein n=1 Tax=Acuticoccus mangrovi TaxID=2796142 RepID=A0A934ISB6_9HYPH|nr:sulfite exporter TauE/SafE family protein [Acuticoccus mangrovi]MBJ3777728.1 sulfite exporter TauE/SafE family protein [Acuticoccus mangrovi]
MTALLPAGVDPWAALALIVLSTLTSALSASVGIGGGVTLLAAMTFVVPIDALIPIHGVVQLGSNVGRAAMQARAATLRLLLPFTVGAVVGAVVGGLLVTDLPEEVILIAIGLFVIVTTWVKLPPLGRGERGVLAIGGAGATVLTMFVGATGPFVMAMLRQAGLSHKSLVATTAAAMTVQHLLKILAFGFLGFAFGAWIPLLAAMIVAGFIGTVIGTRLLHGLPEQSLRTALKVVLTLIGVQLLIRAGFDLW